MTNAYLYYYEGFAFLNVSLKAYMFVFPVYKTGYPPEWNGIYPYIMTIL